MPLNSKLSKNALKLIKKLKNEGYETYLVGGAVRDLLLDQTPKDYDISTNAYPHQVKALFGRCARIIGRRFKLVHVYSGNELFEVSTFRKAPTLEERKSRPTDSGLMVWSDNSYGTLEEDAYRRDFSINAIYYNPFGKKSKTVDLVGGQRDLDNGLIRVIGSPKIRIEEDPVRMLRACKLAGQYGFKLESKLKSEIKINASKLDLSSRVRLLEELFKIFKKPYASSIFNQCDQVGILQFLLPGIALNWNSKLGRKSQKLLKIRDAKIKSSESFPSRVTGFCAVLLPFWNQHVHDIKEDTFTQNSLDIDKECRQWIREILQPYFVPKCISRRIRKTLLMQPKFLNKKQSKKIVHLKEYNMGKDIFLIAKNVVHLEEYAKA